MFSSYDSKMMLRALALAERGIFTTHPNPNVGCVITQGDTIVGEGFHLRAGEHHAEIHALKMAGEKAKGATVYVTLEPCSHFGKTPPCADALIKAGVKRVVCAMIDPNPQVAGRGVARLQGAGIEVSYGLHQEKAQALNAGFIKKMTRALPFVQLKLAASLDGRTALANGESKWITGDKARQDVQVFRAKSGAILSTAKTVNADNARLNVRWDALPDSIKSDYSFENLRQPVRVILDTHGVINLKGQLFDESGDIWILTHKQDLFFPQKNVTVFHLPLKKGKLDLFKVLGLLAEQGIYQVWVEAGAHLAASLLAAELVDELILYQSPKLMGADSRALVELSGFSDMSHLPEFTITDLALLGQDIRLRMTTRPHPFPI